eukprot:TRINITY_DN4422_c0_g1_i6.p1 TRINITY_DN4422_c0_g1~~TRINITY_DN4422_c0_g1_i6.p1  ORF type:complete len:191 (-),score=44.49 TRINITY_DN4422_c0_g1_i6:19-591(-)
MDDPKTNPLLADPTSPNTKEGVCGPLPPIPEEGPHLRPRPEASEDGLQPAHNLLLTTMFTFQFFHWFKPSQAFFADYVLPRYHITNHQLVTEVYAWDTLFQILAAGFTVLVFVGLGLRHALTICAVAAACTVVAVLFFDSLFFLSLIHISEPTRLLSISYAVFCLKKKKILDEHFFLNYLLHHPNTNDTT